MREGVAAGFADQKKVHQFAMIRDQKRVTVVFEEFVSNFQPQNSVTALNTNVRS